MRRDIPFLFRETTPALATNEALVSGNADQGFNRSRELLLRELLTDFAWCTD